MGTASSRRSSSSRQDYGADDATLFAERAKSSAESLGEVRTTKK